MEKIKINNFRKIKDTWEMDLAPITFLTGTNNSGKSSVLKALMMLSDFSLSKNHLELAFNGSNARKHKVDRFSNAANWNNDENKNIEIEFEHKNYNIELNFMPQAKVRNAVPLKGKLALLKMARINDSACFELKHDGGDDYLLKVDDLFFEKGFNEKGGNSNTDELQEANKNLQFIEEEIKKIEVFHNSQISNVDYSKQIDLAESIKSDSMFLNKEHGLTALIIVNFNILKFILMSFEHHDKWPNLELLDLRVIALYLNTPESVLRKYLENKEMSVVNEYMVTNQAFRLLVGEFFVDGVEDKRILSNELLERIENIIRNIDDLNMDSSFTNKTKQLLETVSADIKKMITFIPSKAQKEKFNRNQQTLNRLRSELLKLKSQNVSEKGIKAHRERILKYSRSIQNKVLERQRILPAYHKSLIEFTNKLETVRDELKPIELGLNDFFYKQGALLDEVTKKGKEVSLQIQKYEIQERDSIIQKTELSKLKERKKKIQSVIKSLNKEVVVVNEKDKHFYTSSFSELELDTSEPTVDRIVREVLEKYFESSEAKKKEGSIDLKTETNQLAKFGDHIMDVLSFSVNHLSPHRNSQTRLYVNDDTSSDIYELISNHANHPIVRNSIAGKFLKKWMNQFDIGINYRIKSIEGIASIIEIQEQEEGKWLNLVDKGFGAGQVFTILLRIAQSIDSKLNQTQLILIEEPEANLHPRLQSKLSQLFHDVYIEYGIHFVVETHSEYLIRKSQLIGLENDYFSDDGIANPFKVFYFQKEEGVYEMEYTAEGRFNRDFGEGFYDEATNITMKALKLGRRKR